MVKEKLQLNKKFLVVESPIPFEIFCPEQNDGVKRRQGSWQMTIHDLLTTSHYPLNPIYNLELIYDETLLGENEVVSWYTTDLNLGEALRGIDGQLITWDFDQHLNVNDFIYNGDHKNTSRKVFDNIDKLLNYLELNNISSVILTDCFFAIRRRNVSNDKEYRYDNKTGTLYFKDKNVLETYNVTMVLIYKLANRYFLSFRCTNLIPSTETISFFDNLNVELRTPESYTDDLNFVFEFI